jgi:phenylalanyl-tRNA synthetase beta chain
VQNDEANPDALAVLAQLTEGHEYLAQLFGKRPRIAWQIDPFGHASATAAIAAAAGQPVEASPVPAMTAATQDVSLVVKTSVPAADVQRALLEGAGELLEHARLVDIYRGEGLPEGTHSLTFALRFRAPDRTLTQAEATEAKQAGVALAAERFGAAIRD